MHERCYIDRMAALTLKEIPAELHEKLKASAENRRMSLNAYAISVLDEHETERDRRRRMRQNSQRLEDFVKSLPEVPDPTPLIREDRER